MDIGQPSRRAYLVRLGCVLMIAAAGASATYAVITQPAQFADTPLWPVKWATTYALFIAGYVVTESLAKRADDRFKAVTLAVQAGAAVYLVWLYPAFLVTSLLVVVAWQIAWVATLRTSLRVALTLALVLVAMKCAGQTGGMSLIILLASCAFQLFAVAAAQLARSEAEARAELARAHAELKATQVVLTETARMSERLRISRDLHDVLGHSLTTMTVQLDVASRLATGDSSEHLRLAQQTASSLLEQVRTAVRQVRIHPVDLRSALLALPQGGTGIDIRLHLPEELPPLDPARADAVLRCVQEVITNALRHSRATHLLIELKIDKDDSILVTAQDDGSAGAFAEGEGLGGMRERFEALGGCLRFVSDTGGFRVDGTIPSDRSLT